MNSLEVLLTVKSQNPILFYSYLTLLFLCIGSFLNVVIYRIPRKLEAEYRQDLQNALQDIALEPPESLKPDWSHTQLGGRSYCPICKSKIPFYRNIPVFSYLFQFGKSACCKNSISAQYPIIEFFTATISLLIVMFYPWTVAIYLVPSIWLAISLFVIDFKSNILPDSLTLPFFLLGFAYAAQNHQDNFLYAAGSSLICFLILYILMVTFKWLRGIDGMGGGDPKLFAGIGFWIPLTDIPYAMIIAAVATFVISLLAAQKESEIPFGPGLIIAWGVLVGT